MILTDNVKIMEVNAPVSANNTDDNSDILGMAGWDGVVFIVPITDSVAGGVATLNRTAEHCQQRHRNGRCFRRRRLPLPVPKTMI